MFYGEWKEDKKNGKGDLYYSNNPWKRVMYSGDWKDDRKYGKGKYFVEGGMIEVESNDDK